MPNYYEYQFLQSQARKKSYWYYQITTIFFFSVSVAILVEVATSIWEGGAEWWSLVLVAIQIFTGLSYINLRAPENQRWLASFRELAKTGRGVRVSFLLFIISIAINWIILPLIGVQLYLTGNQRYENHKYDEAVWFYEQSIKMDTGIFSDLFSVTVEDVNRPFVNVSTYGLAQTVEALGNYEKAQSTYQSLIEADQCFLFAYWRSAQLHTINGNYFEARQLTDWGIFLLEGTTNCASQFSRSTKLYLGFILHLTRARTLIIASKSENIAMLKVAEKELDTSFERLQSLQQLPSVQRPNYTDVQLNYMFINYHYWNGRIEFELGQCDEAINHAESIEQRASNPENLGSTLFLRYEESQHWEDNIQCQGQP